MLNNCVIHHDKFKPKFYYFIPDRTGFSPCFLIGRFFDVSTIFELKSFLLILVILGHINLLVPFIFYQYL